MKNCVIYNKAVRRIAAAALAVALTATGAFAAAEIEQSADFLTGKISLQGKHGAAGTTVTLQVFSGGKQISDFTEPSQAQSYAAYVDQDKTAEDGTFNFTMRYKGESENLNGYILFDGAAGSQPFKIDFRSRDEYLGLIERLNSDTAEKAAFADLCAKNLYLLGISDAMAQKTDINAAAGILYGDVRVKKLSTTDGAENTGRFMNFIAAQMANEKKLDSISEYLPKMSVEKELADNIRFFTASAAADKYFAGVMNGIKISSQAAMTDALTEAMLLTAVKYSQGFANLQRVCNEYADFIGISENKYSAAVYKSVTGTSPSSISALASALSAASKNAGESFHGGGTGGAGGGGGSSYKGNSLPLNGVEMKDAFAEKDKINMPFEDMSDAAWAYTAVSVLSNLGIVSGKEPNRFYPNDYITREEFIKLIICAAGIDADKSASAGFSDVDDSKWYSNYVNSAYANGVCKGMSDQLFGVGENILRQDAAVMIYNSIVDKSKMKNEQKTEFADFEDIDGYARKAVTELHNASVINGIGDNIFAPGNLLTRAEAAQIIYGSLELIKNQTHISEEL